MNESTNDFMSEIHAHKNISDRKILATKRGNRFRLKYEKEAKSKVRSSPVGVIMRTGTGLALRGKNQSVSILKFRVIDAARHPILLLTVAERVSVRFERPARCGRAVKRVSGRAAQWLGGYLNSFATSNKSMQLQLFQTHLSSERRVQHYDMSTHAKPQGSGTIESPQ